MLDFALLLFTSAAAEAEAWQYGEAIDVSYRQCFSKEGNVDLIGVQHLALFSRLLSFDKQWRETFNNRNR